MRRLIAASFAALIALTALAPIASAENRGTAIWSGVDVKGRTVDTRKLQGKILLVFINTPELKGRAVPVIDALALRYGGSDRIAQLTLVDLRDAPTTWSAAELLNSTVTERVAEVHDWTVAHIQELLREHDKPTIPRLDRRLHIVLDWEGDLIARYGVHHAPKDVLIVVYAPDGKLLGRFSPGEVKRLIETLDGALDEDTR